MKTAQLNTRPTRFRGTIARGLATSKDDNGPVQPTGGDFDAGLIRGMAVITRGEALGHGIWIDDVMLSQVNAAILASAEKGIKSRFTHPGMSSDGMGKAMGRAKSSRIDGDIVRADLHVLESAHHAPDGDLAAYVMSLATEDPEAFGTSIVFSYDWKAEEQFILDHSDEDGEFTSPDPANEDNLPHARLAELHAVDVVDEPAANPGGLFRRGQEAAAEADSLCAFALGLSKDRPKVTQLGVDPDRAAQFFARFLTHHNLEVVKKDSSMPNPQPGKFATPPKDEEQPAEAKTPADPDADEEDTEQEIETPKEGEPVPEKKKPDGEEEKPAMSTGPGAAFLNAFGPQGGVWFAEGKTFEQAQKLHTDALAAENKSLKDQVKSLTAKLNPRGEQEPLSFGGGETKPLGKAASHTQNLGDGLGTFADSLAVKKKK